VEKPAVMVMESRAPG